MGDYMNTKSKIEILKERKAKIEKQITAIMTRETAQERKDLTRLKILIGAALLADSKINPETAAFIEVVLQRAITENRDVVFLKNKGWLQGVPPKSGQ